MVNSTTRRKKPGTLLYGYRIRIRRASQASIMLPTIFSTTQPGLWSDLQHDTSIVSAALYRRGRLVDQYSKE